MTAYVPPPDPLDVAADMFLKEFPWINPKLDIVRRLGSVGVPVVPGLNLLVKASKDRKIVSVSANGGIPHETDASEPGILGLVSWIVRRLRASNDPWALDDSFPIFTTHINRRLPTPTWPGPLEDGISVVASPSCRAVLFRPDEETDWAILKTAADFDFLAEHLMERRTGTSFKTILAARERLGIAPSPVVRP